MQRLLVRLVELLAAVAIVRRVRSHHGHVAAVATAGARPVPVPRRSRQPQATTPDRAPAPSGEDALTPRVSAVTILKRAGQRFLRDRITDNAAALTYYIVMALVPSALVVVSLVGLFVSNPQKAFENTASLLGIDPRSQVGQDLQQFLQLVTHSSSGAKTLFVFSLVTALWSFSGAMGAVMAAVNRVWEREEKRNFAFRRMLAVAMSLVTAVVALAGIGAIALSAGLGSRLVEHYHLSSTWQPIFTYVPYVVLLVIVTLYLAGVYWISPDKTHRVWRWISVGAACGTVVWLVATVGFAFYVATAASYSKVYGKLAAIPIGLFWIYLSSTAILMGAAIDAEIERATPAAGATD